MTEHGRVILLSGPIGAGKTTVARKLLPLLPRPTSYIEGDTFWSFVPKTSGMERRENFRVILRSMTAACVPFARSGYDVLLDFSAPPEFLHTAKVILKEIPLDFVVLLPSERVCASRAAKRRLGKFADYAAVSEFYALFRGLERHTLQDDYATAAALARTICDALPKGLFHVD